MVLMFLEVGSEFCSFAVLGLRPIANNSLVPSFPNKKRLYVYDFMEYKSFYSF